MVDEEAFYDCLDESDYFTCKSFGDPKSPEILTQEVEEGPVKLEVPVCKGNVDKSPENLSQEVEDGPNKLEELVPFYTGNVDKSEIASIKNESKSSSCIELKNKMRKKKPLVLHNNERHNRSYLTMFYARAGMMGKVKDSGPCKATGAGLLPKSHVSSEKYQDASCYEKDDSESVHEKFLEKEKARGATHEDNHDVTQMSFTSRSMTTLNANLGNTRKMKKNSNEERKMKCKSKPIQISELGGLGPNIVPEKLELLRRRQDYGKIVNEKNKLKILENQVVQKLRQEIRESKKF